MSPLRNKDYSDNRIQYLLSLPDEVFPKILSFLGNEDLFKLRQVSKQMKKYADYELKSRKVELVVNQRNQLRFQGLCEVFRDIRDLKFNCTTLPFEQLIENCIGKLTKITSLYVFASYCNAENIHLISDVFVNIRDLSLIWIEADDDGLGLLFSRLTQLRTVQIEAVPVSGSCFAHLGKDVESITFDTDFSDMDINSLFNCDRSALNMLHLVADQIVGIDMFFESLSKKAPNVEYFGLKLRSNLRNFDRLFLSKLNTFTLSVYGVDGDFENLNAMNSVENISLDVAGVSDLNLARIITNFPKLDWLDLNLSRNSDIKFSSDFVTRMGTLTSLQYIGLHDNDFRRSKYDVNGFHQNVFIEIVRRLPYICEVDLHLSTLNIDEPFEELINSVKSIVKSRSNVWFELFINGTEIRLN